MLAPADRSLLLEALRPPVGYRLGRAVATTYTLDLLALLTAPLAFTYYDWETEDGRPSADPLALLEAVRRHAERLTVFCQGGAIHVPRDGQPLFAHLEPCVVEVAAPRGGVFHPKLWLLRYEPSEDEDEPIRFRMLVGTRNLTFDRSWDTLLHLEGELLERRRSAFRANRPLSEFIAALPDLAVGKAPVGAREAARELSEQVLRVKWELPAHVEAIEFLPLGIDGLGPRRGELPFDGRHARLAIAPFADAWFLERFGGDRDDGVVVSRAEALQEASAGQEDAACLAPYAEWRVLSDAVEEEQGVDDTESDEPADEALGGLHAKLFVVDDGWTTRVWTGSANATRAAFERNVEFLVALDGPKSRWGTAAILAREEQGGLNDLLEHWLPVEVDDDEERQLLRELERECEDVRDALSAAALELRLTGADEAHTLELRGRCPSLPEGTSVRAWPVVLPAAHAQAIEPGRAELLASFSLSLEAATAFLAFEVAARRSGLESRLRFARRLPISGLPEDRDRRLLRSLLGDRDRVLRLLHLLLSAEAISVERLTQALGARGDAGGADGDLHLGLPLFEALVTAYARSPRALEPVERLVDDLSRSEEGRDLLPEGFEGLWTAVRGAREEDAR